MVHEYGYLVDLFTVKLDETSGEPTSWIQAFPYGVWQHPYYGEIKSDPERVQRFADNVNSGVRGQELDIDYDHKERTGEAAGWVKAAEAHPEQGLRLLVQWTPDAAQKIKNKAYRYFSPEFVDEWKHPQTGATYQDVLFGGGITNRPFLKGIAPVNLSEKFGHQPPEGEGMDPKALRAQLGLAEDATDDQVMQKLQELQNPPTPPVPPTPPPQPDPTPTPTPTPAPQPDPTPAQLSDAVLEGLKPLFDANPQIKELVEAHERDQKYLAELQAATRLAEVERNLMRYNQETGRRIKLTPVMLAEAKKLLLMAGTNKQLSDAIYGLLNMVVEAKAVHFELGEIGRSRNTLSEVDPVTEFPTLVKQVQDEHTGMTYAEAVNFASKRNPQLFRDYTAAMRS